jgi:SAM-dependent methyltransferase
LQCLDSLKLMATYDDTASFFDGTVDMYDEWFLRDIHYMDLLVSIVRRLRKYSPQCILELGCGTGNLSSLLAKHFPQSDVKAVDISQELLGQAAVKCASFPNVTFEMQDILGAVGDLPRGTSVVANYSLHHLVDAEKTLLCKELAGALGPGDVVLIGDVFYPPPPPSPDDTESARANAVLRLFYARAQYYLSVVGLDRCVFEIEHLPLVLQGRREHLVRQGYWSQIANAHGLLPVADDPVGPTELGNFLVELVSRAD